MQTVRIFCGRGWLPVVGIAILMCSAVESGKLSEDPQKSVRLCGNRLVDAVLELCNNKLYEPRTRRDVDSQEGDEKPSAVGHPDDPSRSRSSEKQARREALTALRRSVRGIVNECCRNRCTIKDLMMYCAVDR